MATEQKVEQRWRRPRPTRSPPSREHAVFLESTDDEAAWVIAGMHHVIVHTVGRRSGTAHKVVLPFCAIPTAAGWWSPRSPGPIGIRPGTSTSRHRRQPRDPLPCPRRGVLVGAGGVGERRRARPDLGPLARRSGVVRRLPGEDRADHPAGAPARDAPELIRLRRHAVERGNGGRASGRDPRSARARGRWRAGRRVGRSSDAGAARERRP